jgi:hypothetical protein
MSVGGVIVDVVPVADDKWWINTLAPGSDTRGGHAVAVYCDPRPERPEPGDSLWWQGGTCYWTPADRSRADVPLKKIGFSGVAHPHALRCSVCGCTLEFCREHGVCPAPDLARLLTNPLREPGDTR